MKKKLVVFITAIVLSVGVWGFVDRTPVCAGCGCAMECGNTCSAECSDCGTYQQCVNKGIECCKAAHKQMGDTGPCLVYTD